MKRQTYRIECGGEYIATAHAWNSCEAKIRDHLRTLGGTWERCGSWFDVVKVDPWHHAAGSISWRQGGKVLTFRATLEN